MLRVVNPKVEPGRYARFLTEPFVFTRAREFGRVTSPSAGYVHEFVYFPLGTEPRRPEGCDPFSREEVEVVRYLIVSRHPAAVEFIRYEAARLGAEMYGFADAPVLASVTENDVRGSIVAGNLPLHLAARCAEVYAIEFEGTAPRGAEYGLDDMFAAGAVLRRYKVERIED